MTDNIDAHHPVVEGPIDPDLFSKGLAEGKVGTFSGAILGISSVAPGYTLTASIGLIVAAVGLKMPAIFIAGFIPMFLTAYAYRELNSRAADCGASFTWSTKAFGPYVGWMCGWGMVIATIIVLSNLAAIAVEFFYLFIARIVRQPRDRRPRRQQGHQHRDDAGVHRHRHAGSRAGASPPASACSSCSSGFRWCVLIAFALVAFVHVGSGEAPAGLSFDLDWFNPFTGLALGAFVIGVTGSIFAFWGWDTCLTLGEESKDPTQDARPGRPAVRARRSW